jgi:hypothetical protein
VSRLGPTLFESSSAARLRDRSGRGPLSPCAQMAFAPTRAGAAFGSRRRGCGIENPTVETRGRADSVQRDSTLFWGLTDPVPTQRKLAAERMSEIFDGISSRREITALLGAPRRTTWVGRRKHALVLCLRDIAARHSGGHVLGRHPVRLTVLQNPLREVVPAPDFRRDLAECSYRRVPYPRVKSLIETNRQQPSNTQGHTRPQDPSNLLAPAHPRQFHRLDGLIGRIGLEVGQSS